ncbi:MAG: hypothetical protein EBZ77_05915 [Chitinophagia bacterium]|nr:hypothetical protein [Chitinophagia bacterium]
MRAGTVTLSYIVAGCAARMTMNVLQLPGAYVRPLSDTMLCPGGRVSLLAGTSTGAYYQWYTSSGPISGATDAFYTTTTPGSFSVAVASTFGCRSVSAPVSVTLNPATASASAAGFTTFCSGGSVVLNGNTGSGLTYQWTNGGAAIAGATNAIYTATTSGTYAVQVTNSTGCAATSGTIPVTVLPIPSTGVTVVGATTLCPGDSVSLVADYTAGATYQWQNGTIDIAGAN